MAARCDDAVPGCASFNMSNIVGDFIEKGMQ